MLPPLPFPCLKQTVCATGTGEESWDVEQNLRTYVLHQITLQFNKPFPWALCARFWGNEARSDHHLVMRLAI